MIQYDHILKDFSSQGIDLDKNQKKVIHLFCNKYSKKQTFLNFLTQKKCKGFYVYGDVGRGKTMVMKYLFEKTQEPKKQFHYIEFMKEIRASIQEFEGLSNPIEKTATKMAKSCQMLFIDEFQVEDVSDAMTLVNLLGELKKRGVFFIFTSNAMPRNLYENGLQRDKFINMFVKFVNDFEVFEFDGTKDYRSINISLRSNEDEDAFDQEDIKRFLDFNFQNSFYNTQINLSGRNFLTKGTSKDFLWISFQDFFSQNLAVGDFVELCQRYEWFFIDNFIECDESRNDLIRRFIGFIDIAYMKKSKIKFFKSGLLTSEIYKGEALDFFWNRTVSRINEMQKQT